jgi:hypothetical protein
MAELLLTLVAMGTNFTMACSGNWRYSIGFNRFSKQEHTMFQTVNSREKYENSGTLPCE